MTRLYIDLGDPGFVKTYEQVHAGLFWAFGRASEHPCITCPEQAAHWAYLYTAEGASELVDPTGSRYSEDFGDYAPMCIGCHRRFDVEHSPAVREALRVQIAALDGWRILEQRRQSDPELAQRLGRIRGENGRVALAKTNAIRRKCRECVLISNPAGVGRHQKFSGHKGYEDAAIVC